MELACRSILPLSDPTVEQRTAYQAAIESIFVLAGDDLKPNEGNALRVFAAQLGKPGAARIDPGTVERALLALDQIAIRAAEGTLTPNMAAWKAQQLNRAS